MFLTGDIVCHWGFHGGMYIIYTQLHTHILSCVLGMLCYSCYSQWLQRKAMSRLPVSNMQSKYRERYQQDYQLPINLDANMYIINISLYTDLWT